MRPARAFVIGGLAFGAVACSAVFGDTRQCTTDGDCAGYGKNAICSANNVCTLPGGGTPVGGTPAAPTPPASTGAPEQPAGPLAVIYVSPNVASVQAGLTQQFSATGQDANGKAPNPAPTFTWSVSGGGTIGATGLFTAGSAVGGPYTVTVTSGDIKATATLNVVTKPPMTVNIGEMNVLNVDDNGNQNLLLAQEATLDRAATLKSLTFYITNAAGNLRLGLYDDTGPNGGPGAKKAETAEVAAVAGWMTVPVVTPVALAKGNYWLAYAPSDNALGFRQAGDGTGHLAYFSQTYGPMPDAFSTTPTTDTNRWSFYATLTSP